ncbi:MAG: hypothetical protein J7494_03635 [Sphingobium sp.]|nr:hypothetical protein [Sphingobium sp.]
MIALLLALQELPAKTSPTLLDIHFDLAQPPSASPDPDVIVVQGRRLNVRLLPLPDLHEELLPKAQTGLFGGTLALVGGATQLPGGAISNRIMLNWKLPF